MIRRLKFSNFRVLRDVELNLGNMALLIGPNGSGKSTVLEALKFIANPNEAPDVFDMLSAIAQKRPGASVTIVAEFGDPFDGLSLEHEWTLDLSTRTAGHRATFLRNGGRAIDDETQSALAALRKLRVFSLDQTAIAQPQPLTQNAELASSGLGLAVVLDQLRDQTPERFDEVNAQIARWLPEFDRILFSTTNRGERSLHLRTREDHQSFPIQHLSEGTRFALVMLTLAFLPFPPPIICIEEPDRGIHPRLLRHVQDALYRLSYPESFGENRPPVQVIATTHSPYLVDLFSEHLDDVIVANRNGDNVAFERLIDLPNAKEIVGGSQLGEVWYSGILGGVPWQS